MLYHLLTTSSLAPIYLSPVVLWQVQERGSLGEDPMCHQVPFETQQFITLPLTDASRGEARVFAESSAVWTAT